jgi:predicted tellurium resistance membrane protein TerC
MERFPVIIVLGAALIGWVAGDAISHDPGLKFVFEGNTLLAYATKVACAVFVVLVGKFLGHRSASKSASA